MPHRATETPTRPLLARTWKAAALAVGLSLAATQYMARQGPQPGGAAVASLRGPADPETTGALGPAASVRLDPCTARERR